MNSPLIEGPVVLVTPPVASRLARPLVDLLRQCAARGERIPDDVAATVRALEIAGRAYRAHAAAEIARSESGTSERSEANGAAMVSSLSTREVAHMLGTGSRNVTALARRGTLPGRSTSAGWLFDADDVAELVRSREAGL